jgi:hypothetical protein
MFRLVLSLAAVAVASVACRTAWAAQPKEVDDRGKGPWPVDVPNVFRYIDAFNAGSKNCGPYTMIISAD